MTGSSPRGPGRPRKPATREILEATASILCEGGYPAFTIDLLAARAGLGRATVYRRWPTKLQLVAELLRSMAATFELADTGELRADLMAFLSMSTGSDLMRTERILATIIAEAFNNAELAAVVRREYLNHTRDAVAAMFERASARGELRGGVELSLLVNAVWGFVWQRRFIARLAIDKPTARAFVESLLSGLRVR